MSRHFPFDLDRRFSPVWRLLGAHRPGNGVTVTDDGRLVARLGRFRTEAPLSHVTRAHATGPYRWWKAIGVRLSLADSGLTFGTNARRGVCIELDPPLRRVVGFRDHRGLTVTVADVDGLLAALDTRR